MKEDTEKYDEFLLVETGKMKDIISFIGTYR